MKVEIGNLHIVAGRWLVSIMRRVMVPGRLSWSKSDFDSWQKSFEVTRRNVNNFCLAKRSADTVRVGHCGRATPYQPGTVASHQANKMFFSDLSLMSLVTRSVTVSECHQMVWLSTSTVVHWCYCVCVQNLFLFWHLIYRTVLRRAGSLSMLLFSTWLFVIPTAKQRCPCVCNVGAALQYWLWKSDRRVV